MEIIKHKPSPYELGDRVIVTQQIPQRTHSWTIRTEGEVVAFEQHKTGSWYAHSKGDKLWLDRLTLRTEDGEIVVCSLDCNTHVQVISPTESSDHREIG